MLSQNPFMPATPQGSADDDFAYDQMAQEEALRLGLGQMLHQQSLGDRAAGRALVPQALGRAAGGEFPQFGEAIRSGANAMMEPIRQGGRALQTYITGGPSSISSATAAAQSASPSAMSQAASYASPALSAAGIGLNAYQGLQSGRASGEQLQAAIDSGLLDPEQIEDLRERFFEQGMESGTQGFYRGGLSGIGLGPIGMIAGAGAGAVGGFKQAAMANQGGAMSDAAAMARWQADPRNEGFGREAVRREGMNLAQSLARKGLSGGGLRNVF